jgi:hypothetical protein
VGRIIILFVIAYRMWDHFQQLILIILTPAFAITFVVYLVVLSSEYSYSGFCSQSCGWHTYGHFRAAHDVEPSAVPFGIIGDPTK